VDPTTSSPDLLSQLVLIASKVLDGSGEGVSPVVYALITLIASKAWNKLYTGLAEVKELLKTAVTTLQKIVEGDISLSVRVDKPVEVVVDKPLDLALPVPLRVAFVDPDDGADRGDTHTEGDAG